MPKSPAKPLTITLALCAAMVPAASAAEPWQLMSRHGECAPIRSLERKFPDLGEVAGPDAFIAWARAKGFEVNVREMGMERARAVEVRVPAKDLSLVFVTSDACQKMQAR